MWSRGWSQHQVGLPAVTAEIILQTRIVSRSVGRGQAWLVVGNSRCRAVTADAGMWPGPHCPHYSLELGWAKLWCNCVIQQVIFCIERLWLCGAAALAVIPGDFICLLGTLPLHWVGTLYWNATTTQNQYTQIQIRFPLLTAVLVLWTFDKRTNTRVKMVSYLKFLKIFSSKRRVSLFKIKQVRKLNWIAES